MTIQELKDEIQRLKKQRNAILLVHNYQRPEIQEIADYLGDSLGLSVAAKNADARVIVFCGVSFMAETAKLLSPDKTVLMPVKDARCPMADMVSPEDVARARAQHPDAAVVSYVNTNADTKAVSDATCTSRNAVELVRSLKAREIIFLPDRNLAAFVASRLPDRRLLAGQGFCYVHAAMTPEDVLSSKKEHPHAVVMVHPECPPETCALADHVVSTGGMVELARTLDVAEFIVGTEIGLIERLRREFPDKRFYTLGPARVCRNMKKITLEDVRDSLLHMRHAVEIDPEVARPARAAVERMFDVLSRKTEVIP